MSNVIHHMTVIRYAADGCQREPLRIDWPAWDDVESAIRQMDNYCYPIVWLHLNDDDGDPDIFNIVGGSGRWALFQMMGHWQFEDPDGSDEEVWLWDSDQGYGCKERNLLRDVEQVLRIVKAFCSHGSYAKLTTDI